MPQPVIAPDPPAERSIGSRLVLSLALILAALCFSQGVTQPIIRLSQLYVFSDTHSLASAVHALYLDREFLLAFVVLTFSILLPSLKLVYLFTVVGLPDKQLIRWGRALRGLEWIGKWSMHDVLVLALTIFYVKSSGIGNAASLPGIYFFAVSVMLIMLVSGAIKSSIAHATRAHIIPTTGARISSVRRFIVVFLALLAAGSLALGTTQPVIQLERLFIWTDRHSIASIIGALYVDGEYFLSAIILIFSILFPIMKLLYLLIVVSLPTEQPDLRARRVERLEWLGKWSMMDVLVLALMIFYVNSTGLTAASSLSGIYFFTFSILCNMLAYGLVKKAAL